MRTLRKNVAQPWVVMPLVALLAIGSWWIWFRPNNGDNAAAATPTEQLVTATSGPMAQTVSAEGTIAAAQTDDLSFTSAGTVTAVNVKAGQTVKTGDVLATIDSAALQSAVADAESTVAQAAAKLADDKRAGASTTQIAADQSSLTSAQDQLTSAQAELAGAQLVATFDGTVAAVNITVGEQLTSGGTGGTDATGSASGSGRTASSLPSGNGNGSSNGNDTNSNASSAEPQIQVVSTSSFTVALGFDDTDIGNLAVGQPATVTLSSASSRNGAGVFGGGGGAQFFRNLENGAAQALTGSGTATGNGSGSGNGGAATTIAGASSATGTVTEVGAVASASTGVAQYPVTAAFTDTSGDFHAGANATVAITYAQKQDVVQVPVFAVTNSNGSASVTVSKNGKQETRTVTTGLTAGGMVEITSGLTAGEQVVLSRPGARFAGGGVNAGNGSSGPKQGAAGNG